MLAGLSKNEILRTPPDFCASVESIAKKTISNDPDRRDHSRMSLHDHQTSLRVTGRLAACFRPIRWARRARKNI
jgi:hypothetical protein